jgi:uncharacterized iron-regulated membrane protein
LAAPQVHFGLWGGLATRILYVFLGFARLVGLVTGFWRWRLHKGAERRSQDRLRALIQTAPPSVRRALRVKGFDGPTPQEP